MKLLTKGFIMPENPTASAFGAEVVWTAGVVLGATIIVIGVKKLGRKALSLKNRNA